MKTLLTILVLTPLLFSINAAFAKSTCTLEGVKVGESQSIRAYKFPRVFSGDNCWSKSQRRVCRKNGTLSGSFPYKKCSIRSRSACYNTDEIIAHGRTVDRYITLQRLEGASDCDRPPMKATLTCNDGTITSSLGYFNQNYRYHLAYDYKTCKNVSVNAYFKRQNKLRKRITNTLLNIRDMRNVISLHANQPCKLAFQNLSHGNSIRAWGIGRDSIIRRCNNGVLSGPKTAKYISWTMAAFARNVVGKNASCRFDGRTFKDNEVFTAFSRDLPSFFGTLINGRSGNQHKTQRDCRHISLKCVNGSVRSAYNVRSVPRHFKYSSCEPAGPKRSCKIAAVAGNPAETVAHGKSRWGYLKRLYRHMSCTSGIVMRRQTCVDGNLVQFKHPIISQEYFVTTLMGPVVPHCNMR